jgi:protein-S-isoprenylcysteine O-methyltransferase Ste14
MPTLGLALLAFYGLLAFGVRMAVAVWRTGSTGLVAARQLSGLLEWTCGLLFVTAIALCVAGPVLQLAGGVGPIRALDGALTDILGVLLAVVGIAITVVAQFAMGDAWRIGVDQTEQTDLVTHGPFSIVRNPIYAAMIPSLAGIALLAHNPVTIAGALLLAVALELQIRLIEEPHLRRIHGRRYAAYAGRVGRFLPGIGRL